MEGSQGLQSAALNRRSSIPGFAALEEIALDMRWSWSHSAERMWRQLDPNLWELTHNPWVVLQTVSQEKLEMALQDSEFIEIVEGLIQRKQAQENSKTWFRENYAQSPFTYVAYFSMEYMLSESLPIYSGGLGNVAGDQLKAASNLGVPVVAVGLLYQQGYFRQTIDAKGVQQALYPYNDPGQLPIIPLRKPNGEWLRLEIAFPGWSIWIRAWQVNVGRNKLFLLDSNDAANFPAYRAITSELYGGGQELRLQQELLLGIGGWKLLEALGFYPEVCHLNEGHAAFAILERARSFMQEKHISFEAALAATRAGNVFTTHTAVPAGFDRFAPSLIEKYLSRYISQLGISMHDFLALGRKNPEDDTELFNMAYLAVRGSGAVNGVSRLHSKVSRTIFESLFPRWPEEEVPVGVVTNGVHIPSWISEVSDQLWSEVWGKERWNWVRKCEEADLSLLSDEKLWKMRSSSRKKLVEYARSRLSRQLASQGAPLEDIEKAQHVFDENTLTIGFARRFATYKRPNMLLQDKERLLRLLLNPRYPVQLILAGKAHPADKPGQALIQEWFELIHSNPQVRERVIFLVDYDVFLTQKLVQGVDVWLNTPRRPWEACGTSGMKVLCNGGLNLSELDGWWVEAYKPDLGWAIGDGKEHGNDLSWDAKEADQLYTLLEEEVIPSFYRRDKEGFPTEWIQKMRSSMTYLTPRFSANRAVQEYTERYYAPAAEKYLQRSKDKGKMGQAILHWSQLLAVKWSKIRFNEVKIVKNQTSYDFEVLIYLDGLDPDYIKVQVYAAPRGEEAPFTQDMLFGRALSGEANFYVYTASVAIDRAQEEYTIRVVPFFPSVSVPLEEKHILWQK